LDRVDDWVKRQQSLCRFLVMQFGSPYSVERQCLEAT